MEDRRLTKEMSANLHYSFVISYRMVGGVRVSRGVSLEQFLSLSLSVSLERDDKNR